MKLNSYPAKDYDYETSSDSAKTNPPNRIVPLPQFKIQHSKFKISTPQFTGHQSATFVQLFKDFSNVWQRLAALFRLFYELLQLFRNFCSLLLISTKKPISSPKSDFNPAHFVILKKYLTQLIGLNNSFDNLGNLSPS
ncbi:MAG: hypothetical protein ACYSSO_12815 [Planctomycetota bacterium]|jgi:hypothetical protein